MKNKVFVATSMDGYIADRNGGIDWLHSIPNPEQNDMGYAKFMNDIDALVMGRTTYETILGFDIDWPYKKPVFVLSKKLTKVPNELKGKVEILKGALPKLLEVIRNKGYHNLYIDGGSVIQAFLRDDLIDEITITRIPILLGSGTPLFSDLAAPLKFECSETAIFLDQVVQNTFVRKR